MTIHLLGIAGSIRTGSYNAALLRAIAGMMGERAHMSFADIGRVPHYNADEDGEVKPAGAQAFIDAVANADALLFATPEYNYGIPGVLKNAIDWASRPAFRSPLAGKPTAIVGAAKGSVGTARAQANLRQVLAGTITPVFPYPEVLVGRAAERFDANGALVEGQTRTIISGYVGAFLSWVDRMRAVAL